MRGPREPLIRQLRCRLPSEHSSKAHERRVRRLLPPSPRQPRTVPRPAHRAGRRHREHALVRRVRCDAPEA